MLEREFQPYVIGEIRRRLPGCVIQKLDSGYQQGIPDLLILFGDRWAILEVKKSRRARPMPNQPHFVEKFNEMSFSAFVYPENVEEVLYDLEQALRAGRPSRFLKC